MRCAISFEQKGKMVGEGTKESKSAIRTDERSKRLNQCRSISNQLGFFRELK